MTERWTIRDGTTKIKGYLQILCDGEHAADVFPFGAGRDADKVKRRAYEMVRILNEAVLRQQLVNGHAEAALVLDKAGYTTDPRIAEAVTKPESN